MKDVKQQLAEILKEYGDEIRESVKEAVDDSSKKTNQRLRTSGPLLTGRYRRGWTVTGVEETWKGVEVTVYNRNKPRLTHILNDGWTMRNGRRHKGDGHIDNVEEYAQELLIKEVEEKL